MEKSKYKINKEVFMKKRKLISFLSVLVLLAGILSSCKNTKVDTASSKPVVSRNTVTPTSSFHSSKKLPRIPEKDWIEVDMLHVSDPLDRIENDMVLLTELAAFTGVKLNIEVLNPGSGSYKEQIVARFISKSLPDLVNAQENADEYGPAPHSMLVDLTPYIDGCEYFKKYVSGLPGSMDILKSYVDGKIYAFPQYRLIERELMYGRVYRADLMEEYGIDLPVTNNDWYNAYKVVKSKDASISCFSEADVGFYRRNQNLNNWNLATIDMAKFWGFVGTDLKKAVFLPITPEYKAMVEYNYKLGAENLLGDEMKNGLSYDSWFENYLMGGQVFSTSTLVCDRLTRAENETEEKGLDLEMACIPQNEKTGKIQYFNEGNPWIGHGISISAAVTGDKLTKVINMLDFMYSDYAINLFQFGVEDTDFTIDTETKALLHQGGNTRYEIQQYVKEKVGFAYYLARVSHLYDQMMTYGIDMADENIENFYYNRAKACENILLPIPIKYEGVVELDEINKQLTSYAISSLKGFIYGEKNLSDWDTYVAQCKAFKCDEGTAIVQKWIDKYYEVTK